MVGKRGDIMSGSRFFAPITAALTAALLCLPAAPAPAAGYPGTNGGFHANPFGGYQGNFSGFRGNFNGNPGYYPGYFSSQGGYSSSTGFGAYYTPSYSRPGPGYNSYFTPYTLYSGTGSSYVSPAYQPPGPPPPDGTAAVGVHVPADAEVFFNGDSTKQTGEQREFITPTLPVGRMYEYEVRAHWKENGKDVDETRTITVRANQRAEVDFTQPQQEKVGAPK
jgi:uncharacterized protein (TIGR03000 family)